MQWRGQHGGQWRWARTSGGVTVAKRKGRPVDAEHQEASEVRVVERGPRASKVPSGLDLDELPKSGAAADNEVSPISEVGYGLGVQRAGDEDRDERKELHGSH